MRLITAIFTLTFIAHSFQSHPQYTYVCKENGDIEFTGFSVHSNVTVDHSNKTCETASPVEGRTGVVKITANCIDGTVEENRNVTVRVQDKNIQENGHGIVTLSGVIGGLADHEFVLTCNSITKVNKTVLRQFHIDNNEVIYPGKNEISGVDMRFKPSDDISLPDVSELYIGDKFYLFLIYKGDSKYRIEPQACTAYEGNDYMSSNIKKQPLWKYKSDYDENNCLDPSAQSYGLMDPVGFQYVDDKTVRAKLHAFRFSDSEDVTISCRVLLTPVQVAVNPDSRVCPTASTPAPTTAALSTEASTTTNNRRKRESPFRKQSKRAMKTLHGRHKRESNLQDSAFKTLVVKDKGTGNQASRVGPSSTIYYVISLIGITALNIV